MVQKAMSVAVSGFQNPQGGDISKLQKSFENSLNAFAEKIGVQFQAIGTVLKTSLDRIDTMEASMNLSLDLQKSLQSDLEALGTPNPKSILNKGYEDRFLAGKENDKGEKTFTLKDKEHRNALKSLLLEKGEKDVRFLRIAQNLEAAGAITKSDAMLLKSEKIEILG
jgi:hypothetical protein